MGTNPLAQPRPSIRTVPLQPYPPALATRRLVPVLAYHSGRLVVAEPHVASAQQVERLRLQVGLEVREQLPRLVLLLLAQHAQHALHAAKRPPTPRLHRHAAPVLRRLPCAQHRRASLHAQRGLVGAVRCVAPVQAVLGVEVVHVVPVRVERRQARRCEVRRELGVRVAESGEAEVVAGLDGGLRGGHAEQQREVVRVAHAQLLARDDEHRVGAVAYEHARLARPHHYGAARAQVDVDGGRVVEQVDVAVGALLDHKRLAGDLARPPHDRLVAALADDVILRVELRLRRCCNGSDGVKDGDGDDCGGSGGGGCGLLFFVCWFSGLAGGQAGVGDGVAVGGGREDVVDGGVELGGLSVGLDAREVWLVGRRG